MNDIDSFITLIKDCAPPRGENDKIDEMCGPRIENSKMDGSLANHPSLSF